VDRRDRGRIEFQTAKVHQAFDRVAAGEVKTLIIAHKDRLARFGFDFLYINDDLQLSDRVWACPNCGAEHDRDENGAINIEMEGVSLLADSGYIGVTPLEFAASGLKFVSI
jgi:hypothetical protein